MDKKNVRIKEWYQSFCTKEGLGAEKEKRESMTTEAYADYMLTSFHAHDNIKDKSKYEEFRIKYRNYIPINEIINLSKNNIKGDNNNE